MYCYSNHSLSLSLWILQETNVILMIYLIQKTAWQHSILSASDQLPPTPAIRHTTYQGRPKELVFELEPILSGVVKHQCVNVRMHEKKKSKPDLCIQLSHFFSSSLPYVFCLMLVLLPHLPPTHAHTQWFCVPNFRSSMGWSSWHRTQSAPRPSTSVTLASGWVGSALESVQIQASGLGQNPLALVSSSNHCKWLFFTPSVIPSEARFILGTVKFVRLLCELRKHRTHFDTAD